ncbi:UNVERIFIED_CONTAM: hypothetical protein RMT77_003106 [Armadillidium vulgare]
MFCKSVGKILNNFKRNTFILGKNILYEPCLVQTRSHVVLRRKHPVPPLEAHRDWRLLKLEDKYFIYETVEEDKKEFDSLKVLLIKPVEELGLPGDIVDVEPDMARDDLLLTGKAVYASAENIEKYGRLKDEHDYDVPSSQFAYKTVRFLESTVHTVYVSLENPWTIEPWHIKVGLRRGGISVPENSITVPSTPIVGPDLNLEGKEFLSKVKVNNKEEARLRVRIRHVATLEANNLPLIEKYWLKFVEPVFPGTEEAEILAELNRNDPKMILEENF